MIKNRDLFDLTIPVKSRKAAGFRFGQGLTLGQFTPLDNCGIMFMFFKVEEKSI